MRDARTPGRGERALIWWDTSLPVNWIVLPVAAGLFVASINISDRAGIANASKIAKGTVVTGSIERSGFRRRQLIIKDRAGVRSAISCGAPYVATNCLPVTALNTKLQPLTVKIFSFRGEDILLSAKDVTGRTIVSRDERQRQLGGVDQVARGESWGGSFIMGIMYGLVIAIIRYAIFVRPKRRRRFTGQL